MGWKDWGKKLLGVVADTTVDMAASALEVCGSVACTVGGGGFAVAEAMNKTFRGSYAVSASSVGGLDLIAGFEGTKLDINYTLPFHIKEQQASNADYYQLSDYVNPNTVQLVSGSLWGVGLVFRNLGSALKKFQQYRYEVREQIGQAYLASPSRQEYLVGIKSSTFSSLSIGLSSYAIVNALVYSDLLGSDLGVTYPFGGAQHSNRTYYNGPITSHIVNFHIPFEPQEIPVIGKLAVLVNMSAKGLVNVSGGMGLSFQENAPSAIPPALLTAGAVVTGLSAYIAGNFFARKGQRLHNERLSGDEMTDLLIGNEVANFSINHGVVSQK